MKESEITNKTEYKLNTLMQSIPGGVAKIILNDDLDILLASDGFYDMSGYTEEEFYKKPFWGKGIHFIMEEDIPLVKKAIDQVILNMKPACTEFRIKRKDGKICWTTAYSTKVELCSKDFVLNVILIDTTETKEIEHKMVLLTEGAPGGIARIAVAEDFHVDYANDYFYEIFGYEKEELKAEGFDIRASQLIYKDDREMVRQNADCFVNHKDSKNFLEYRIVKKSGEIRWVRTTAIHAEEDGKDNKNLDCVFLDMTESKQLENNILLNEERYRIITEQTQDIIFDWDIASQVLYYTPVFEKKFGYSIPTEDTMEYLKESDFILKEDKESFFNTIKGLKEDIVNASGEVRLKKADGSYIWCRYRTTTIADVAGVPFRIVGIIRDIDEYKKETRVLQRRAQIDLLTGLLNKMTAQEWIKDCLKHSDERKKHALFIIDIDDFKSVNDHLGHSVGDAVLTEIASRIKSQFRETDIIGRIGGDEFAVFMEYIDSEERVTQKAEYLCDVFRHSYLGSQGDIHVSGSIGIALFPIHGASFQQLYERADAALYVAKGKGKDCYAFYSENTMQESLRIHEALGDNNVESDEYSKVDFSQLIFEILYDISDMKIAINIILDLISRRYNIQHIYIYKYLREQGIMAKIYEHCLNGESVEFMSQIPCTKENVNMLLRLCDIDGVYLSTELEEKPEEFQKFFFDKGVHSFLLVPIMDDGEFDGIIGFSEDRKERAWRKEESDISILLSKIIVTFLIKRKHKKRVEKTKAVTSAVLQQANLRTHMVDDNYILVDTNDKKWKEREQHTGPKCFEHFYEATSPCADCPIHKLNEKENRYTYELYSSHNDRWEEITASAFQWDDGSVKYLLTCYDITKHKKRQKHIN